MRSIAVVSLLAFLLSIWGSSAAAAEPPQALALKYPEVASKGDTSRFGRLPQDHILEPAIIHSRKSWVVRVPGIAGNSPLVRLVAISVGTRDEYFLVCDGGVGMAVREIYGPVSLNLAELDVLPQRKELEFLH